MGNRPQSFLYLYFKQLPSRRRIIRMALALALASIVDCCRSHNVTALTFGLQGSCAPILSLGTVPPP